jgi:hypothetical protein
MTPLWLRALANEPAANGFVPIHPDTLRELAGMLDAAPPPAANAVSVDGLMEAMNGPKGELDAWLEARDEAEVRAAIVAALAARGKP